MDYEVNGLIIETVEAKEPTRLAQMRRLRGYTQAQLAEMLGMSLRTLQQYESRARSINRAAYDTVIDIAKVLECSPDDIIEKRA